MTSTAHPSTAHPSTIRPPGLDLELDPPARRARRRTSTEAAGARARATLRAALRAAEARAADLARAEDALRWSGAPVPAAAGYEREALEADRRDRAAALRRLDLMPV